MASIFRAKKADFFLPGLVLITIVVFTTLGYYIAANNGEREKEIPVGTQSLALLQLNSEINNLDFYLEKSSFYASKSAVDILAENAGYPEKNTCRKTEKTLGEDSFVIFDSSCGKFNPIESYKSQFESSLNPYLLGYRSSYSTESIDPSLFDRAKAVLLFSGTQSELYGPSTLQSTYSNIVVRSRASSDEIMPGAQLVTLTPLRYPIAYSTNTSYLEYTPRISTPSPGLSEFTELYKILRQCTQNPDRVLCASAIKSGFPSAVISEKGAYLQISTHSASNIRLLFNPESPLPENTASFSKLSA